MLGNCFAYNRADTVRGLRCPDVKGHLPEVGILSIRQIDKRAYPITNAIVLAILNTSYDLNVCSRALATQAHVGPNRITMRKESLNKCFIDNSDFGAVCNIKLI